MFTELKQRFWHLQFTRKYQQAFLEDLSSLIEDGVPASQAIDTIVEIADNITQIVAKHISANLSRGQSLADGMKTWFSHSVIEVIRVGESSGALPETLKAAANTYREYSNTFNAFLVSTLYPVTVLIIALTMTVFIKNTVLSSFLDIKPITSWPPVGKNLYRIGYIVEKWWWLISISLISFALIIDSLLKNLTGKVRYWIDEIPLISLYRSNLAARFMETLGLLISNGVILKQALSTLQYDAEPYFSWHLLQMEYNLSGGQENIADVLNTNLIHHNDLIRLRVVAKGKGFEHALVSLGRQARRRIAKTIERTGKFIGAFFMIIAASLAMTIVFGIYTVGSILT